MGAREPNIAELVARESLRSLVIAYSRAIDRRDFVLLRGLYWDDSRDSHGDMFSGGPDAYVEFVRDALSAYEATVHYVVNMNFAIAGDEAEGEIHKINYHRTHPPHAREIVTGSRGFDRYARRDGEWRFLSRAITLDWARARPVDPAAYEDFAARSPPGRAGPDDPSYHLLSLFTRFDA